MDDTGTIRTVGARMEHQQRPRPRYEEPSYKVLKRIFDIVFSVFVIIVLLPVYALLSLVVLIGDGWPVLYFSPRIGQDGKSFKMAKFRTMRRNADQILEQNPELKKQFLENFKLEHDPRLIRFGETLRKTSMDELPQMINVLKGEMSIVGPRPMLLSEVERYGDRRDTYDKMRPGCAGLWQCSGRSEVSYDERIRLNEEYYWTTTFRRDLWLLVRTVKSMLMGRGAY